MSEFLEDPSVLTKDKLKSVLLANNVSLPNSEQRKDVYVQLYLKNLTAQNKKTSAPPPEPFSSDDELPAPVVSNRSSRSGRVGTWAVVAPLAAWSVADAGSRQHKVCLFICSLCSFRLCRFAWHFAHGYGHAG